MIQKLQYFIGSCTDPHRNLARDRWKYGEVYGRSFLLEGLRLSVGYLFDRNPEL